jgi:2-C-methyl-D-erythritol 4-phosphate cytidylyltransferase
MQEQASAIILATGAAHHPGGDAMLWAPLCGRIVLARTIDVFQSSPSIAHIILVTSAARLQEGEALCNHEDWHKVGTVVAAGEHAPDRVRAGLDALERVAPACSHVLIHDGARPLVSIPLLAAALEAAREHQAATAAVPVKDTVKQVEQGRIRATLDRSQIWRLQTPQIFSLPLIRQAHQAPPVHEEEAADDAILLMRMGERVTIFPGSYSNIKISTQEDLLLAEALLQEFSTL